MSETTTAPVRVRAVKCGMCGNVIESVPLEEWQERHRGARCRNCNNGEDLWTMESMSDRLAAHEEGESLPDLEHTHEEDEDYGEDEY